MKFSDSEKKEFEVIIEKVYDSVSGYELEVPYKKYLLEWDDNKKIKLIHYIFTRNFEFTRDATFQNANNYLVNYAFLIQLFKDEINISEKDIIEIIRNYKSHKTHFILYDTSGISFFMKRVVALYPPKKSGEVASELLEYKKVLENTEIAFEKDRAKTKKTVLKLLTKYE
jgi:hypothetical protein